MKKTIIITCLLWLPVVLLNAQQADTASVKADTTHKLFTIKGVVSEAETKELFPGVVVQLLDTKLGSLTNLKGQYLIKNIPQGFYTLTARTMGYETFLIENINVNNDSLINIKLWVQWLKDPRGVVRSSIHIRPGLKYNTTEGLVETQYWRLSLIKGIVSDIVSGAALCDIVVTITDAKGENENRYTDSEGFYRFTNIPAENYIIKIEKYGYKPISKKIKLTRSQEIVLDFKMAKTE